MNKITIVNKYKEPNHIYCGRGSALGNPFVLTSENQRDEVCDKYEIWFNNKVKNKDTKVLAMLDVIAVAHKQEDINLGCFCAPKRCHCETIKKYIKEIL